MVLIIFPNTMSQSLAVEPPTGRKNMRAPRQVRVTCTMILKDGKPVCRGAGAPHLPRSNGVSWACIARNPPPERSNPLSGENLIHQVRELRRNPHGDALSRRLSELRSSSVSGGTADGGKEHEGSAADENHLHPGKPSLPSFIKIVWCRCVASAAIQLHKTVPVGSRTSGAHPLAGEPPTGGKDMRAPRPHTPRQVRITCTPANRFAVHYFFTGTRQSRFNNSQMFVFRI